MTVSRVMLATILASGIGLFSGQAAGERTPVQFEEAPPPYPEQSPPVGERHAARPGATVYRERATGLPGARLTESLTLKNAPGGNRVTIKPDEDLPKYYVNSVPYFCGLYV